MGANMRQIRQIIIVTAVSIIVSMILVEAVLTLMLFNPSLARSRLHFLVRSLYMEKCRNIIQWGPRSSRFAPELLYTLKPEEFEFSNVEFRTTYYVNGMGLRDIGGIT